MTRLTGRRTLVVGGNGYIGAEVVSSLLDAGAAVANIDTGPSPKSGAESTTVGDVVDYAGCKAAIDDAVAQLGGLDAMVFAAGVMLADDGPIGSVPEAAWDRTFAVNAKGAWISATHALPWLKLGRSPAIVFVGSVASEKGSTVSQLAYTASKGALAAMATELAVSLAPHGIRVNRVSPGPLDGGLLGPRLSDSISEKGRARAIPMGRLCTPRDVARACLFLLEEDGDYLTGANLIVDGGLTAVLM